ncbi:hypothetical protein LDENG_00238530, partial [Lucifuga dentata]
SLPPSQIHFTGGLQFTHKQNRSTDDALTYLEQRDSYVRMLFVEYSSAFNTILLSQLIIKVQDMELSSALCTWTLNFLSDRPQKVRLGDITSPILMLSTRVPLLCSARLCSHTLLQHIIKFADDMTIIGLITGNDEMAYREEVRTLTSWCQDNNLHLNVKKTKEMVLYFRTAKRAHTPHLHQWYTSGEGQKLQVPWGPYQQGPEVVNTH